jgi:hypothetical protein
MSIKGIWIKYVIVHQQGKREWRTYSNHTKIGKGKITGDVSKFQDTRNNNKCPKI